MADGVAVPDSGIEGVFEPDSSGEDSDPLSDMMAKDWFSVAATTPDRCWLIFC